MKKKAIDRNRLASDKVNIGVIKKLMAIIVEIETVIVIREVVLPVLD